MAHGPVGQRKGYRYLGLTFSADGGTAWLDGSEYREVELPRERQRRFNLGIALVIFLTFPGIPLFAKFGFQRYFLLGFLAFVVILFWFNRAVHRCPGCNQPPQQHTTPYANAPVLFFCRHCRTFYEHGQIDGGWPSV